MSLTLGSALLLLAACTHSDAAAESTEGPTKQSAGPGAKPADEERLVRVIDLVPRAVEERLPCSSHVAALHEVDVLALARGQVVEVLVREGQHVDKGDVLFRLDDREAKLNLEVARTRERDTANKQKEAELSVTETTDRQAQATLEHEQAERALTRTKKSAAEELSSVTALEDAQLARDKTKNALDLAVTAHKRAQLGLKIAATEAAAATLQRRIQERLLEDYTIKAPIAGVVPELIVRGGEWVAPQASLCRIVADRDLVLQLNRPQREFAKLRTGQSVEVTVDAFEDQTFHGTIDLVAPVVDTQTGTFRARVRLSDAVGKLRPGMFCRAWIITGKSHEALMIPKQAVVYEAAKPYAFVVRDGRAERIAIDRGIELKDALEARNKGTEPGPGRFVPHDKIVTVGMDKLEPGATRVRVEQ